MEIQKWLKGNTTSLFKKFGKEFRSVEFTPPSGGVLEFIQFGQNDWVIILPITKENLVITVKQFKQGCNKIITELPAGTVNENENPLFTAIRELREETGYTNTGKDRIKLGQFWMNSRSSWTQFFCYLFKNCELTTNPKQDIEEEIEVELTPLKKWIEMCHSTIEEPSSIVCTFRALKHL